METETYGLYEAVRLGKITKPNGQPYKDAHKVGVLAKTLGYKKTAFNSRSRPCFSFSEDDIALLNQKIREHYRQTA